MLIVKESFIGCTVWGRKKFILKDCSQSDLKELFESGHAEKIIKKEDESDSNTSGKRKNK